MVMYDVQESTPHARNFAGVIERMAVELDDVVSMLSKPSGLTQRLVELHRLENEGDEIYYKAIAELFRNESNPLTVIKWKDIYEKLEAAVDRCENVANIIESVIIKHTWKAEFRIQKSEARIKTKTGLNLILLDSEFWLLNSAFILWPLHSASSF